MKCPQCGLVTFDDLPQCPRCKESFALVRPLASASADGSRHVLRDDPELRLRLRDRLHRARIHRRKQNENPLATGPDPDAPDWFAPDTGEDNGAAETSFPLEPAAGERSKETEIVNFDDPSPDDDARGGATTADAEDEAGIIEASREPEDTDEPEFAGEIPGFTDWREELRERLKRIRARREKERLLADAASEAANRAVAEAAEREERAAKHESATAAETEATVATPDSTVVDEPEATVVAAAEAMVIAEPEAAVVAEPEATAVAEPEAPAVAEPEATAVAEPEAPVIAGPETTPVAEPEATVAETEAAESAEKEAAGIAPEERARNDVTDGPAYADVVEEPAPDKAVDEPAGSGAEVPGGRAAAGWDQAERGAPGAATASDFIAQIVDGRATTPPPRPSEDGAEPIDLDLVLDPYPESEDGGLELAAQDDVDVARKDAPDVDAEIAARQGFPDFDFELAGPPTSSALDELAADPGEADIDFGEAAAVEADEAEAADLAALEGHTAGDAEVAALDDRAAGDAEVPDPEDRTADDAEVSTHEPESDDLTAGDAGGATGDGTFAPARRPVFSWGATSPPETTSGSEPGADKVGEEPPADDTFAAAEASGAADEPLPEDDKTRVAATEALEGDENAAATEGKEIAEHGENASAPEEDSPKDEGKPAADAGEIPELDFDEAPAAVAGPALQIDVGAEEADEDKQALAWDDDEELDPLAETKSSAGPLGERAAAALCDLLVLTTIGAALVGAAASGTELPFRQVLMEQTLWLGMTWAIFVVGYSVFLVGSCGQTIGRMVMRLRVVGTDQFSVGFDRAAIRLAAWLVSALPLLAGMIPALKDPQRRGLHDRLSHTRVVKA